MDLDSWTGCTVTVAGRTRDSRDFIGLGDVTGLWTVCGPGRGPMPLRPAVNTLY